MEDEHAVSRLILGPFMLKNHEMRFDMMADPVPVPWYRGKSSRSQASMSL